MEGIKEGIKEGMKEGMKKRMMNNPWIILGIADDADDKMVKQAWLKWIKRYPPDRAPELFQQIQQAYEQLKTERLRTAQRLFHPQPPTRDEILLALLQEREPTPPSLSLCQQLLKAGAEQP